MGPEMAAEIEFLKGAAVAFGLMGMGQAIRTNYDRLRACVFHSPPYSGGPCMRCGYDDGMRRSLDGETWTTADDRGPAK